MINEKKKNKNPYLNPDGSFNMIDEFIGIDYMLYSGEKSKKEKDDEKIKDK